jgi:heme-degrading monooxygenase HmoA
MSIVRLFRVRIHPALRTEFEAKFAVVSVNAVRDAQGALGVEIFKPTRWDRDEYLMISHWQDEDALRRFAGEDWNRAFIPPGMEQFVAECDVHHYTAWETA